MWSRWRNREKTGDKEEKDNMKSNRDDDVKIPTAQSKIVNKLLERLVIWFCCSNIKTSLGTIYATL